MHIVLEWVEEAFKEPDVNSEASSKSAVAAAAEVMDETSNDQAEKENSEEKENVNNNNGSNGNGGSCNNVTTDANPMSKLFYGKVLIEGTIQGEPFSKIEAFGQWPLRVNSFTHIHDSLENSTAHESFVSTKGGLTDDSGQERWFIQLPPVMFLELSRFHYNTERRIAEKIHKRLDFPDTIFMDRYMVKNKAVTRLKRDQVRLLKEKRRVLKDRLEKFTQFGSEAPGVEPGSLEAVATRLSIPEILNLTMTFALGTATTTTPTSTTAPAPLLDAKAYLVSSSSIMMQVLNVCTICGPFGSSAHALAWLH